MSANGDFLLLLVIGLIIRRFYVDLDGGRRDLRMPKRPLVGLLRAYACSMPFLLLGVAFLKGATPEKWDEKGWGRVGYQPLRMLLKR